jgi:multidrug transporter EmrE-like cation transporter
MEKYIPLILFSVFTNFGSQVLLKHGMTTIASFDVSSQGLMKALPAIIFNGYIIFGLIVMMISMSSHLIVLSRVDISYAYPFLGLSFVLITLWGYFILGESVNLYRVIGVMFICCGVAVVAKTA